MILVSLILVSYYRPKFFGLTNAQSTLITCPKKSTPFKPSMAALASLNVSYSINAYPFR